MSFQNHIFGQSGKRITNSQERKAPGKSNNPVTRGGSHERSGSFGEKNLLKQTRHIKQNSLSRLNDPIEDILLKNPLQNDSTRQQFLTNELQGDLIEFVTGKVSTYLAEVRSFVSNAFERVSCLQAGISFDDMQEILQNFKASKAFIEEQTQQMERNVLKLNFALNSQKNHEKLKSRQKDDPLVVKRFYSGQESNSSQQQDVANQKLEDIVSYLSQKNTFLLNRLQSSPVRATRMDFLATDNEKMSSRKIVEPRILKNQQPILTAQSSQKDLLQQIDSLGLISEIKGLRIQNKDLLTDLKNIQEKYKETKRENEFLISDNKKVWQDLDKTKSLFEIEKQMHQELKRILRIKAKTGEIKKSLPSKDNSPERINTNEKSRKDQNDIKAEDLQNMFKKFEQDNLALDQLRSELKTLQERLSSEKEQNQTASLQKQMIESEKIKDFNLSIQEINDSLKGISSQDSEDLLEIFASEIDRLLKAVKSFMQMDREDPLERLQENSHQILKKISLQQKEELQDFALSELLEIAKIIKQKCNSDEIDDKELHKIKVVSVLKEKLGNLIHNIFVKTESAQALKTEKENQNTELLEKLRQKETEIEAINFKLKNSSDELQASLKNQAQKILRQVKQNLGDKNDVENEEGLLESIEQKIDQICQDYIHEMNEKIMMSQQKQNENQLQLDSLKKENKLKEREISDLLQEKNKLEQETQLYLNQETKTQQTIKDLKKEIESLRLAKQELQIDSDTQILKLGESLKILEGMLENLQKEKNKEIQDLSIALEEITKELEKSHLEKDALHRKIQDQNETIELSKMNLAESQKSTIERFNAHLIEMENLKQENLIFRQNLASKEEEVRKIKEICESLETNHKIEMAESQQEIRQKSQIVIDLEVFKTQLEKDLTDKNQEIDILKTQLQEEAQKKAQEISELQAERRNVASLLQSLEGENVKIKEHLEGLEKQLNQYSSEKATLKGEVHKSQKALEINVELYQKALIEIDQLKLQSSDLENRIKHTEEKNQLLVVSFGNAETNTMILKEELSAKELELNQIRKEMEIIRDQTNIQYEESVSKLSKEILTLQLLNRELEAKINKIQTAGFQEVESLKRQAEKETETLETRLKEEQGQRISSEETVSKLSKELDALRVLKEELEAELKTIKTSMENANEQFRAKSEAMESQLKEEHAKRISSEDILSKEITSLKLLKEEELERIQATKIQELENMRQQFKAQIESLDIQLQEEKQKTISSDARYKETLYNLSKESDTLKALKEQHELEINQIQTSNTQKIESLKIQLAKEETERVTLQTTITGLSKELEEVRALKTRELESTKQQFELLEIRLKEERISSDAQYEQALSTSKALNQELEMKLHQMEVSKTQEIESLNLQLAKEETERRTLETTITGLSKELEEVRASKTQELESTNQQFEKEIADLKSQLQEIENEKASSKTLYEEAVSNLSKELADLKILKEEQENEQSKTQTSMIQQFKKEIETLQRQLKEEQEQRASAERNVSDLSNQLAALKTLTEEQQIKLNNKAQELESAQLKSEKEIETLKVRLMTEEAQRISSEKESEEKTIEFNKIQALKTQELESTKQQFELLEIRLKEERISSDAQYEQALSTSKALNQELENKLHQIEISKAQEIESLKTQLAKEETERGTLETTITGLSKELAEVQASKFQELESTKQQFEKEIAYLKSQLQEIENEKASSKTLYEETVSNLSKELANLKILKEEQESEQGKTQTTIIQQFKKEIETLQNQLKEEKEQAMSNLSTSKALNQELEMKLYQMEVSKAQEIESLKIQLEEEENKIISSEAFFEEQTNIHNETVANLSNELEALKVLKKKELEAKEIELHEVQNTKQKLEKEIESLETQLREEQNKRSSSEEAFSEVSKELETLKALKEEELERKTTELHKIQTVNLQETEIIKQKFEKEIELLGAQLREEKDKRISFEALYEEENKIHEETVLELSKELETLKEQMTNNEKLANSIKEKLEADLSEKTRLLLIFESKEKQSAESENAATQTDLAQKMLTFLEAFVQQTLHHTKTIYQGIESTTARDVEFAFYTAFKGIIESNHNMISKLNDIKLLELNLSLQDSDPVLSEILGKLNQSLEQNQKARNLCNDLERISCAGSPISLQLHRMRSYQEENHSAVYDPRNLDMSGSISKFESSFMDIAAQHGADLEDSLSQKDEAMKSLESKIDVLNISHQKIAEENNLLKRNVENTSKIQGQLRIANEQFAAEYDKLVEELKDRETDEERFALQIKILKKELEETRARLAQSEGANEREHLKKILVKFLDIIFRAKQTKETAEMLKIICSMLFCSEAEKNKLLELFNRSIPRKSNSLLKVFS